MKRESTNIGFLIGLCFILSSFQQKASKFISYTTPASSITFYCHDDKNQLLRSIQNLKSYVERQGKELTFAMNGGMYRKDNSPQGLFIDDGIIKASLDTLSGAGNFYLKPNGVFYITKGGEAVICKTGDFKYSNEIKFATQSGPMLLTDGNVHSAFIKGSSNLNIRNGVGILPGGKVIFAMSKGEVNFYDFADFFKSMGCKDALYLDGFVSRTYLPEKNWQQLDGNFGVMIGVVK